ncbi:MAG: endonuclease [Bacteroidales bacterium]|jgi:endonuclease I|nr:endonuclease [Bacteroidales bacterium]
MKRFYLWLIFISPFIGITQPVGYYNGVEGLYGEELKEKLNSIISEHYYYNRNSLGATSNVWFNNNNNAYSNAKLVFIESDADPEIPGNVIDLYRGESFDGNNYGSANGTLNREHIWAKSHGAFPENSAMYCDYHNLRPSEAGINRKKSNLDFDEGGVEFENSGCHYTSNSWEPRDPVKGDVARIVFYMATRYLGASGEIKLEVVNSLNTYPQPKHGKLDALYAWNGRDLPDEFELNRNEVLHKYQGNRNPYIDNPRWIEMIWGDRMSSNILIGDMAQSPKIATSFNPVEISAVISGIQSSASVQLMWGYSIDDLGNSVEMEKEGSIWIAQIPSQSDNSKIYLRIVVEEEGNITESVCYNYTSYDGYPIEKIQGSGNVSPYEGDNVTATGIVTAVYTDGYYIQDHTGMRSGIYVRDKNRKVFIGSLVQITGIVADYYGLTEIKDISNYQLLMVKYPNFDPLLMTASQASKDYQSMFVRLNNATCAALPNSNGIWTIADHSGAIEIHNNTSYTFFPELNKVYSIQGVLTYSYGTWKIELRQAGDVEIFTDIDDPEDAYHLTAYPNPAQDIIHVQYDETITEKYVIIHIFSMDGKSRHTEKVKTKQLKKGYPIDIQYLHSGTWILSVQDAKKRTNKIFIKK